MGKLEILNSSFVFFYKTKTFLDLHGEFFVSNNVVGKVEVEYIQCSFTTKDATAV